MTIDATLAYRHIDKCMNVFFVFSIIFCVHVGIKLMNKNNNKYYVTIKTR